MTLVKPLCSVQNLEKSFGGRQLFKEVSFGLAPGERVGLVGPNGAGKSTLMKIIAGEMSADAGEVVYTKGLRVGFLKQTPEFAESLSIHDALVSVVKDSLDLSAAYRELAHLSLEEAGLSPERKVSELSGGWQKRIALACELVKEPDLLLLDEPTNHLDIESILWLEELLAKSGFATLTVTHDRLFLQKISQRILDLDPRNPKGLLSIHGDYADYLQVKEALISEQVEREKSLRNTFRKEQAWLRAGAQARQTKQKARSERAIELGEEVSELASTNQQRRAKIDFGSQGRSPKKLIEARKLGKAYGDKWLFSDLDLLVTPKTRLGLIGRNGSGKSSLLRTLLGEEKPSAGEVHFSDSLVVAHFEQTREELDPNLSLLQAISYEGDYVDFQGQFVFARSYLSRFLFRPEQMDLPVGRLSGGEKSRLRLAQLMLKKANLLVLDEPTNDLDLETLRVLEESLLAFDGAVILVSHDRFFLDQVVHEILAFPPVEGSSRGQLEKFMGYYQWEQWWQQQKKQSAPSGKAKSALDNASPAPRKRKLSFKEQREWDSMENRILTAEAELEDLTTQSRQESVLSDSEKLVEISTRMSQLNAELGELYERWSELEDIVEGKS